MAGVTSVANYGNGHEQVTIAPLARLDEPMRRLLDYDHRRYWLVNGWSVRFRIAEFEVSVARPYGIKYSFTLHDVGGTRLLGYDNAHGSAFEFEAEETLLAIAARRPEVLREIIAAFRAMLSVSGSIWGQLQFGFGRLPRRKKPAF